MKSELEQKSIDLLNWLEHTIKTTTEFGAEQIPLFIQELLQYNYCISLTLFIVSIIGLILSVYFTYKFIRWVMVNAEYALPSSLFFIFPILGCVVAACDNMEWVMIQLAPRVYLLEYVKDMVKH